MSDPQPNPNLPPMDPRLEAWLTARPVVAPEAFAERVEAAVNDLAAGDPVDAFDEWLSDWPVEASETLVDRVGAALEIPDQRRVVPFPTITRWVGAAAAVLVFAVGAALMWQGPEAGPALAEGSPNAVTANVAAGVASEAQSSAATRRAAAASGSSTRAVPATAAAFSTLAASAAPTTETQIDEASAAEFEELLLLSELLADASFLADSEFGMSSYN